MIARHFPQVLILFLLLAGCSLRQESAVASQDRAAGSVGSMSASRPEAGSSAQSAKEEDEGTASRPGYQVYRTPDTKAWPRYRLPLDIRIKVPAVPEEITKPSPPIR